jgi:TPP-dependent pyruvate/acetoin dehydrogenase alpha subunit
VGYEAVVATEVDQATEEAERSPMPEARDALLGVYADPPAAPELWFRRDVGRVVDAHERPASWGTYDG